MSRLCRLKSYKSIGEDGQWAYDEITTLRQRVAELEKQLAANNPLLDEAADKIDAMEKQIHTLEIALAETEALEISHGERIEKLMKQVTELEKALSEVCKAERERVAQFVDDNCTYGDTHILVKAIRAMGDE